VFSLCLAGTANGQSRSGYTASQGVGVYGGAGENLGASPDDPSNSGSGLNSVNLYTGQHQESLPLISLAGRGGIGVSLSLDYNGNVRNVVRKENRKAQAGPFGLGFELGVPKIVADHRNTTDVFDDYYVLQDGNSSVRLFYLQDSTFTTEQASPWKIYRHLADVSGTQMAIGWTIVREDGTVYRYGDLQSVDTLWNATGWILKYGRFVGSGNNASDSRYATSWSLKQIHDVENLNWVDFTYLLDTVYLEVRKDDTQTENSANPYVRASYLLSAETVDGNRLEITYEDRTDKHVFYGFNNYEFFYSKRAEEILHIGRLGDTLSRTALRFDYLDGDRGSQFSKLVLIAIIRKTGDGSESLPPTTLTYHADPDDAWFGSIQAITSSLGAIREFTYSLLPDSANWSSLHRQLVYDSLYNLYDDEHRRLTLANNVAILKEQNTAFGEQNIIIFYWDGYWRDTTLQVYGSWLDQPSVSQDGYAIIPDGNNILIPQWRGGYWQIDTLENALLREGTGKITIHPGRDCFVAVASTYSTTRPTELKRAYYFHKDGDNWIDTLIVAAAGFVYRFSSVQLSDETFCVAAVDTFTIPLFGLRYSYKVVKGRWNAATKLANMGTYSGVDPNYQPIGKIAVSNDLVALIGFHNLNIFQWDGSGWVDTVITTAIDTTMWSVRATTNGLAFGYSHDDGSPAYVGFLTYDSTWFNRTRFTLGGYYPNPISLTNNSLVVQYSEQEDAYLWEWNGYRWVYDSHHVLDGPWESDHAFLHYQDAYMLGRTDGSGQLKVKRYLGNSNWASWSEFANAGSCWAGSMDMFVSHTSIDTGTVFVWNPYADSTSYLEFDYEWPFVLDSVLDSLGAVGTHYVASPASFGSFQEYYYDPPHLCHLEDNCPDSMSLIVDLYRLIDTQFVDRPAMSVVSRIELYESLTDTDPRRVDFAYIGGLMDPAGLSPRFCQVQVSTPYFASDSVPVGYTVHNYYNNVDSNSFYDTSLFSGVSVPADLSDSMVFGIPGGGFHLDGMEYYSYSFTVGDSPSKTQDSQRQYFSVQKVDSLWGTELDNDVFHTRLDSTRSVADSLTSVISYSYHPVTQQVIESRTRHIITPDTTYWYVNRQTPAFDDPEISGTDMEDDNALAQVSDNQSWYFAYDSSGVAADSSLLSHSRAEYALVGGWKPVRSYTWRDLSTETDTLFQSDTLDASEGAWKNGFGSITSSKSATGVISSAKLDPFGIQVVASAGNARPGEWSVFDAEYSIDFDGWRNSAGGDGFLSTNESFTGRFCYELHERGLTEDTGLVRSFSAADLVSDRYILLAWTKAHSYPGMAFTAFDNDTACATDTVAPGLCSDWSLMSLYVDLTTCPTFDSLQVCLFACLSDTASDTIAFFDDIRFYPVDATIETNVFDSATGLTVAGAGNDNLPTRSTYDEFHRNVLVCDEDGDTLTVTGYRYSHGITSDSLHVLLHAIDTVEAIAIVPYDQSVKYRISIRTFPERRGEGKAFFYVNSSLIDQIDCPHFGGCPNWKTDSGFVNVAGGDSLRIVLWIDGDTSGTTVKGTVFYAELYDYDPSQPHFVSTETFIPGQPQRAKAVTFFNSLGEELQTRSTNLINDTARALVSGLKEKDVLGNVTRSYLPYYDVLGPSDVDDYSAFSQAVAEAEAYYDGTKAADCDTVVYRKANYSSTVKPKLVSSESPGLEWAGRLTSFADTTFIDSNFVKKVTTDQDGVKTISIQDRWGRYSETRNSYEPNKSLGNVSYADQVGRDTAVYLDTLLENPSAVPIRLLAMKYNDLGQEIERWKVDYGTIRMIYDKSGNLRFMQNDKRKIENSCVYYKYDQAGRKIEEGLLLDSDSLMTQANADMLTFPADTSVVNVKYRWYYDYYSGNATIISPGRLVRVESEDTLYYRNFYFDPVTRTDSVITRLPMMYNPYKKVIHEFFEDGSLKKMTVYPRKSGSTWVVSEKREFEYSYDEAGHLSRVSRPEVGDNVYSYVEYEYDAAGKLTQERLGVDHREWILFDPPYFVNWDDTLQQIDYTYNALGMLTGINWPDTSTVIDSLIGYQDHFGEKIDYIDTSGIKFYNGRVRQISTQHSDIGNVVTEHRFIYDYDDLGWLTYADYNGDEFVDNRDRRYTYDAFGRRLSMDVDTNVTIDYTYYTNTIGSSRLATFTDMVADSMIYDTLGNLVADSSRPVYLQTYDYRNLLAYSRVEKNLPTSPPNTLEFTYDENGQRIQKVFNYYYMDDCGTDTGIGTLGGGAFAMGSGGGGGLEQCPFPTNTELNYLYDNGVLLATFDKNGNTVGMYVNSGGERLAQYATNDDDKLYYHLTDHLGSPRILLHDRPDTSQPPQVMHVYAYYPFGELLQSWGNNESIHQFTGHEKDEHSSFDYHYFGARYYDARLGTFTSIDKASQFASGYVYGANNPIMANDPDGNFAWFPVILGALAGSISGAQIADARGLEGLDYLGCVLGGAAIGAASGYAGGAVGRAIDNPISGGLLAGATAGSVNGFGMGSLANARDGDLWDATWRSALSGGVGGYVGGALSTKVSGVYSSFAGGFASGVAGYALAHHRESNQLWNSVAAGSISGSISSASYMIEAGIRYHRSSSSVVDLADREQLSLATRRSNAIGKEVGGVIQTNGKTEATAVGTADKVSINVPSSSAATFHTHVKAAAGPGMTLSPGLSGADISAMNVSKVPMVAISPDGIYYAYPGGISTTLPSGTDYYLMFNYYNLTYYGDYWQYANRRY
jgi:RHS repeat-associated protein